MLFRSHAEIAVKPAKGHGVSAQLGPLYAAEKDNGATGRHRGFFTKLKYAFPLPSVGGVALGGALAGEVLDHGDYYETDEDAATWFRFEVTAKF